MTQSQQQASERQFIAVDFRGVQQASRERTSIGVVGVAGIEVIAGLAAPLPEPAEQEAGAEVRPANVTAASLSFGLGGEGARAAYVYAALGGLVRLAGTVGQDSAGDLVVRWLSDRGAEVAALQRRGKTATTLYLGTPGYQSATVEEAGTATVSVDQAAAVIGERGHALLLAGYPYVGDLRGEGAIQLLQAARERGVRTALSLSPVALGGQGTPLTPADLERLLPHVDLLCGAAAELRRATRRSDLQDAARALIGGGAKAVLAKRGPDGASVFRPSPASLDREDTTTPIVAGRLAAVQGNAHHLATAFGAVYDAAYLLGLALNDASPVRFAAAAATRVALAPNGVLGI